MQLRLISFEICPFVQRSIITLRHKGAEFSLELIDLENPPAWFLKVSPLGKVPALEVDGKTWLFESAVINEFLDEITEPCLMPADALERARHRAWIAFGSECIFSQYDLMTAKTQEDFERHLAVITRQLQQLEDQLGDGPYFAGSTLSLVDAAIAPLLMRYQLMNEWHLLYEADEYPKLAAWTQSLLARDDVTKSVPDDFPAQLRAYLIKQGGYGPDTFTQP
ncbi:glutathione S-transferase [Ectothiorhodosinus mongolicus]|uniref:glutathione transferase n=1 Tax=Ectothiorhodosinus mongolicus TaxID=233100 RepID=A0A1R3W397_9GAMM|nr:glutathione S-transferase family protein [Ectothiorhodosinus mongolicus]ULX57439.1 glutathione S-transferase family protein [Ectothiorhodosinus mongolicus]SIT72191.1 glutathione S-transferase [Ectothiorhodosinus mongolicus]